MQQTMSKLTDKIWAKQFEAMVKKIATEPEGAGWLTFDELLKKTSLNKYQLYTYLAKNVKSGKILKFRGSRQLPGQKKLIACYWYKPAD